MLTRKKTIGIYAATFAAALVVFLIVGLTGGAAPDSGGEWASFILWGVLIGVVAAAIIGSLIAFRGRLTLRRREQRRHESPR